MSSEVLFVIGAALVLLGFISMIRTRFSQVRRRLDPASSIRSRARLGGSAMTTYQAAGDSAVAQTLSVLAMMAGGAVVVISMMLL